MKAMILAAGKGTRVRPLTSVMPKPMIPLVRKPVMESIIEHLARHGFDEIYINTSYLSGHIENYFRDGDRFGVEIAYSYEGELENGEFIDKPIGSAGGMRRIQDFCRFFDQSFVVLCGDALIDVDLKAVIDSHRRSGAIASIVTRSVPREEVSKYGVVVTDDTGRVLRFQEKPSIAEAASTEINTGIYVFEPAIFDHIPAGQEYDIGGQLFPDLIRKGLPVHAVSLPFQWVDIGSVVDFWNATRLALTGQVQGFRLPGREIRPGIRAGLGVRANWDRIHVSGPVYIGSGASIGDGAQITGPTLIGSNCVIEAGAVVRESILDDYTRVSSAANVSDSIVFAGKLIDPYGASVDINDADIGWLLDDARRQVMHDPVYEALREAASP
ncbi:sugar phosphate nucleotidyltransferase [Noviherbaspirillum pedocola]|uniref:NDP-sugar synthase n=1 Tax=Noviherbaspirillum pedocola TaxID=2801341 RepID=A0A934T0Y4_9BURK|nr:NDP-sugar synthase [Noviherbaspirillum pedocola]MBK4735398.1 NDP-sugar synthase [Noviherbaspirillum pedocola]